MMFNDKHMLTHLVMTGEKTMTRRVVSPGIIRMAERDVRVLGGTLEERIMEHSPFLCEKVAVAQSYKALGYDPMFCPIGHEDGLGSEKGWNNKMFVNASLLQTPHQDYRCSG